MRDQSNELARTVMSNNKTTAELVIGFQIWYSAPNDCHPSWLSLRPSKRHRLEGTFFTHFSVTST